MTRCPKPRQLCKNLREVLCKPHIAQALMDKEVELCHMLGPFDESPLDNLVYSPINIVPKSGSTDKYRLIHDLAFLYNSDESVNSCIPESNASLQYHYIEEVIEMGLALGAVLWVCANRCLTCLQKSTFSTVRNSSTSFYVKQKNIFECMCTIQSSIKLCNF